MNPTQPVAQDDQTADDVQAGLRPLGRGAAFLTAVQFLTRVPVPVPVTSSAGPVNMDWCVVYFPLVGALVGMCTASVLGIAGLIWPIWLAVLAALAAELWLTGALHEDAWADFCDAFGGGWTRDDVLAILKDSRVGVYGALALIMGVALRVAAVLGVVQQCGWTRWHCWFAVIVAAAALSRWSMALAMGCLVPVAGRQSLSRGFARRLSWRQVMAAGFWTSAAVAPFAWLMPWHFVLAIGLATAGTWSMLRLMRRRLGGTTGDCLGAIGYVTQLLVLLGAAARLGG